MKYYRVTMFDRNNVRGNIEFVVSATTKPMAIAAAYDELHNIAMSHIELVTSGMSACTSVQLDNKGNAVECTVRRISAEYYNTLIDECWGVAECSVTYAASKSVSSASAVAKAEEALKTAQEESEHDQQGDNSVTRRKRRWTKAEKRAAKAAREMALVA